MHSVENILGLEAVLSPFCLCKALPAHTLCCVDIPQDSYTADSLTLWLSPSQPTTKSAAMLCHLNTQGMLRKNLNKSYPASTLLMSIQNCQLLLQFTVPSK